MRSVEMKNRCLLYYGNPVGYRTEQGVVADSMFRREELEDWLARKGLAVRWEDGIYDRLSSGGYQKAADNGPALKSCRIWQLGPSAPAAMRFIGLDRMSGEYGGPDLTRYQAVFDGTVSTNSLDGIWEAFCRRSLGSDGQPLAISDLVELYDDSGSEFYYVDRTATHVCLNRQANGLSCGSVILLEQLRTIDKSRLRERVGALDTSEMKQIDWALGVSVGLVEGYR